MRLLLIFNLFISVSISLKIFMYIPLLGHSHVNFLGKIADILHDAGHEVTAVMPILEPLIVNKTKLKTTKIFITDMSARRRKEVAEARKGMFKDLWTMSSSPLGMISMTKLLAMMFGYSCDALINEDALISQLKAEKFDLGISEPFNFCGFGLMEHLGIKTTVATFSGVYPEILIHYIGEPAAYSYVPTTNSDTEKMTTIQKILNIFGGFSGFWTFNTIGEEEGIYLKKKFGEKYSGHEKLLGEVSFSFVNANPFLDFPRPVLHKTVQIGGITVDVENPGKLDEKWDKILNERKKNVFISFGSVAKSKDMPLEFKKNILEVCASLPDVAFIWKYEEESTMADHLPNVYLSPWLAQKALLADPRLNLFVTHGGLGSSTEVAYLGTPAIFIPLFADQSRNSAMISRHGGAISLHKEDLANPEKLRQAINTVISDQKYTENAKKLAETLRNQPISSKQLLLSHVEFAAKFGPLKQLEPYGRHLSTFEYYLLDVACLVLGVLLAVITLPIIFIRRFCCGKKKTENKKKAE